ncbi:calbindin-like [Stylophora pistillata]|uniref:Calretinin n=1 Tax=Stylophora pistillata TaxID=50429 RepID=A0A2B4S6D3_STYPI|nr:calbindin-like [Stylophora pistillata]PFX24946.1 Calretinin [Stylophora pistillata]
MADKGSVAPFVKSFQGKAEITSADFLKIFKKFDKDENGFIEAGELDDFLIALAKEKKVGEPDSKQIAEMKEEILQGYDDNFDGKLDLEELANILPTEENFLAKFQHSNILTNVDFFKVWNHYDQDHSGFIESDELEGFLTDLLGREGQSLNPQRITDYQKAMLDLFDKNKDGKLSLPEMSKILPVEDNFLLKFDRDDMTEAQFNEIWSKYDQDGNGFIADEELEALLYDILDKNNKVDIENPCELKKFKSCIMDSFDQNKDGKLGKDELKMMLFA